jgi:hypothetical protein
MFIFLPTLLRLFGIRLCSKAFDEAKVESGLLVGNSRYIDLSKSIYLCISLSISIDFQADGLKLKLAISIIVIFITLNPILIMKGILFFFATAAFAFACSQATENQESFETTRTDTAYFALPIEKANKYIRNYRVYDSAELKNALPRYFTIRATDLLESLGIPKRKMPQLNHQHVRIYLGLDENRIFHLLLTPVEGANLLCSGQPVVGKRLKISGPAVSNECNTALSKRTAFNGEYMLDFTSPCPTLCSEENADDK